MGFSGVRAVVLIAVLVALVLAVTRFDLPGWIIPVGLLLSAAALKGSEKKAEEKKA